MTQTISAIKKKYGGYWLAIKVTRRDKLGVPTHGALLARARTHHELHAALEDDPDQDVYETHGGKVPSKAILF